MSVVKNPGSGLGVVAEMSAALLLAVSLMLLVDAFTGVMPPKWDPVVYTDMARNGVIGNPHLVAPFAYRPAVPLLAGAIARAFGLPLGDAFQWIARVSVVLLIFSAWLLARRFAGSPWRAALPALFAAASIMPVKFALFVPASVDAAAYPLMMLAAWAWFSGRKGLSFGIAAIGLFFKEFLAIPLLLALADFFVSWRRARTRRALATLAAAGFVALAVILVPRLGLPVVESRQEIDPLNNIHSLSRLVMNPLSPGRNLNILLGVLAFWLPLLLLLTRGRASMLRRETVGFRGYIGGFLLLDLSLTMYGGTNILTFLSYAMPIQVFFLALLARGGNDGPHAAEWALALACAACYARLFGDIPLPDDGFEAYVDHYSGWSSRVSPSTLLRFAEIGFYLVLMVGLRAGLRRIRPGVEKAFP